MPAILTHYQFALETLDDETRVFEDLYRLGNQGPDVFMAYGMVPWHKHEDAKQVFPVGAKLHHTKMVDCYANLIDYALGSPDKDLLLVYIEGLFAHYCLDRLAHAYIFYRTGFDEKGELHGFYKWSHGFFEALLDKSISKRKKSYVHPRIAIQGDESRIAKVSKMWHEATSFPLTDESFLLGYYDYVTGMKMIQTRTGWVRPFFRLLMGKYSAAYAQAMPGRLGKYKRIDVENLSHATWKDPSSGAESSDSIDDLFAKAKQDYADFRALLEKAKAGQDIRQELAAWERNLDHDGTPYGESKKYYDLCWEKKEHEI